MGECDAKRSAPNPGVARARWLLELMTVKAGACAEAPQRSLQLPFSFRSRGPSNVNRVPV
ncbi:hypothetical protein ELH63_29605 (plasmid) [Rhizobium ruizarguesonis]|nr:hypothetical protein ELH63_29605 [Rhizobium ruizarguesonis]TBA53823.1 hypothetical protein ELH57_29760 [Rhizobium ruizarguesonis]